MSLESRPRIDVASLGRRPRLAAMLDAADGRDGSGAVGGDGVADRKSGTLRVVCRSGVGAGATALREIEAVSILGSCVCVPFVKLGDGSLETGGGACLPGSGEEAGDAGDTKVSNMGVLTSCFWYSGVGGRPAVERAIGSGFVRLADSDEFLVRWILSDSRLNLDVPVPIPSVASFSCDLVGTGRTLRPGNPTVGSGFEDSGGRGLIVSVVDCVRIEDVSASCFGGGAGVVEAVEP